MFGIPLLVMTLKKAAESVFPPVNVVQIKKKLFQVYAIISHISVFVLPHLEHQVGGVYSSSAVAR